MKCLFFTGYSIIQACARHAASEPTKTVTNTLAANNRTWPIDTHSSAHTHMQVQVQCQCGASQCDLVRFVIGDSSCIKLSRCLTGNNSESVSESVSESEFESACCPDLLRNSGQHLTFVCMQISCIRFRQLTERVAQSKVGGRRAKGI